MNQCTITQEELERIEAVLEQNLVGIGVRTVLLVDTSGNIVAKYDSGDSIGCELCSFAVLASVNCAAMDVMARSLGERKFSLHLLKGRNKTAHFSKVGNRFLLITISDHDVPLGQLRLRIRETVRKVREISESARDEFLRLSFSLGFAGEKGRSESRVNLQKKSNPEKFFPNIPFLTHRKAKARGDHSGHSSVTGFPLNPHYDDMDGLMMA